MPLLCDRQGVATPALRDGQSGAFRAPLCETIHVVEHEQHRPLLGGHRVWNRLNRGETGQHESGQA